MAPRFDPRSDPDHRAGLALVVVGLAISAALLVGQGADPPAHFAGLGDANAASGLLFVMAGAVLIMPRSSRRLARLLCILGVAALAAPVAIRPWFAGA